MYLQHHRRALSLQECYVPRELERTLTNLAMNDDVVYRALRKLFLPPAVPWFTLEN
jgi:hypothetical protein